MAGAKVGAFAIQVESIGDPLSGNLTTVKCGAPLFMLDLKPPSEKLQKKFDKLTGSQRPSPSAKSSHPSAEADGVQRTEPDPADPEFGDAVLEEGLNDLLEEAEQASRPDGGAADDSDDVAYLRFVQSAVQDSWGEGLLSHGASATDELEGELSQFIAEDFEIQKPATQAEEKLFASFSAAASSAGLEQNRALSSLASELATSMDFLPDEAVKEAALNSSRALGTIDLSAQQPAEDIEDDETSGATTSSEDVARLWIEGVEFSLKCFTEQQQALMNQKCGGREDAGVSIVEIPPEEGVHGPRVVLVEWTVPGSEGRIVDIDAEGNLITLMCVGSKRWPTNFQALNANVLVPATGVTYSRDKRHGKFAVRNKLPPNWNRVMLMWKAAHSRIFDADLPFELQLEDGICALCQSHERQSTQPSAVSQPDRPLLCPLCMLHMHKHCAQELAHFADTEPGAFFLGSVTGGPSAPTLPAEFQLPDLFMSSASRTEYWECSDTASASCHTFHHGFCITVWAVF